MVLNGGRIETILVEGIAARVEPGDALFYAYLQFFTKDEIRQELEDSGYHLEYYSEDGYGHAVGRARNSAET